MAHFISQRVVTGPLVVSWMGMLIFPLPARSPFLASASVIHGERGFEPRSSVTRVSQTLAVFLRPLCWDGLYVTRKGIFPWHLQGIFPRCWYWEGRWGNSWVKMTVFRESKHWRNRKEFQLRPSKRKKNRRERGWRRGRKRRGGGYLLPGRSRLNGSRWGLGEGQHWGRMAGARYWV